MVFQVGGPVVGKDFFGRREELSFLERELVRKNRLGVVLYGQRRIGKTSLVKEFARECERRKDVSLAYVDVAGLHPFTLESFYDSVVSASVQAVMRKASTKAIVLQALRGSLEQLANALRDVEVSVSVKEYLQLRVSLKERKAGAGELLKNAFNTAEALAKENNVRLVLALDEFQAAKSLDEGLAWAVRSVLQDWRHACLLVSGSEVSVVAQMIEGKTAPFYMLLKPLKLGPLDEKTTRSLLEKKLGEVSVECTGQALSNAFALTLGAPFYVQWLGDALFDLNKKRVSERDVEIAFKNILAEGETIFSADLSKLSNGERDVFIELCTARQASVSELAEKLGKPANQVSPVLNRLIEKGFVHKLAIPKYASSDEVLAEWVRLKSSQQTP